MQHLEQSLIVLEKELRWRQNNELLQFYEPNKPITDLINMVGKPNSEGNASNLLYILSAANGIGKTTALVNIAGNLMFGPQNSYFDLPLFKKWPYPKRIRFISEVSQIEEGKPLPTEIEKWWPRGRYKKFKDSKHYISRYEAKGWVMEVMTYDQEPKQHEGQNLGMCLFNEPPPENLWTPNISRLRAGGIAIVGMTPLTSAGWFFDKVAPRHTEFTVFADVEKACKQHGIRGHLDHDHIEKMIQEYDPEEREARIEGKAMYLKGLIFKTFYPNVHVLRDNISVPYGASVWNAVDPHSDKPFASIWAFPDARGDIYVFDEWPNEDFYKMHNCQLTINDYKKIFADKEAGLNIHRRIIDRHFADTPTAINKRTLRQELMSIGLNYLPSYKAEEEIDTGIEKIRRYLAYDTSKAVSSINQPKLFISPKCQNLIKSITRWSRDPNTGKVQEAYKDFCDCLRYLLMSSPEMADAVPEYKPIKKWG